MQYRLQLIASSFRFPRRRRRGFPPEDRVGIYILAYPSLHRRTTSISSGVEPPLAPSPDLLPAGHGQCRTYILHYSIAR